MRADERRALPDLTIALLLGGRRVRGLPLLERVALDLGGVRERQGVSSAEPGGRLAERRDQLADDIEPTERDRRGEAHQLAVPERELGGGPALVTQHPEERV